MRGGNAPAYDSTLLTRIRNALQYSLMETANTIRVDPTINSKPELQVVGDRVSRLWNSGNYLCRQHFLNKKGVPVGVNLENL
jgi:hypothetical protein